MKFISKKLAMSTVSFSAVVLLGAVASMTGACTITTTDDSDGGIIDTGDSGTVDGGADSATQATLPFQPSNVLLSAIDTSLAADADVTGNCQIQTDGASDCFPNGYAVQDVTQSDSSKVHVIVVSSLTVEPSAKIQVTGGLPLILISIGDIHLNGSIDANAAGSTRGPGGFTQETANAQGGGAGGGGAGADTNSAGGASYCGLGGAGAVTSGGTVPAIPAAYGAVDLRPLAGGSSGGNGAAGGAGAGGGGIQIVSGGTFTMAQGSYINVGGGGGTYGGTTVQNAGGGGAGGSILIEATTVSLSGILAANGGGGGAGGGGAATVGGDATPNTTAAAGGTNTGAPQSAGGAGGAASAVDGLGGGDLSGSSAGGGGGGAGRVRINTSTGNVDFSTATISPTPGILTDGGADIDGGTSSCVTQGVVRAAGTGI